MKKKPRKSKGPKRTPVIYKEQSQVVEMDLEGNGKKEKIEIRIIPTRMKPAIESNVYTTVTLYRVRPSGVLEKIWFFKDADAYEVKADVCPLDFRKPRRTFLFLNCRHGAGVARVQVFKWETETFREVESGGVWGFGNIAKMRDGRNVIVVKDGEETDIYAYIKDCLAPCNYQYPEMYQEDIRKTLDFFNRHKGDSNIRIEITAQGLMKFLYGGRAREGLALYDRMWELQKQISKGRTGDSGFDNLTALFRAYALLELGRKAAGLDVLRRYAQNEPNLNSRLGNYYYVKNDFKSALKYYRRECAFFEEHIASVERKVRNDPQALMRFKEWVEMQRKNSRACEIKIKLLEKILKGDPVKK